MRMFLLGVAVISLGFVGTLLAEQYRYREYTKQELIEIYNAEAVRSSVHGLSLAFQTGYLSCKDEYGID